MKRCPECRRDYYDDTLLYCLDDGNALLEGPATLGADEPATAILPGTELPSESSTKRQISTTNETAILHDGRGEPKRGFDKRLLAVPFLFAIIVLGGFLGFRYLGSNSKQIESIAVMPFVNESGNADVEYLADGMTETLISSLSQLPNLNVKGRSSVFRYKGKDLDTKALGKELGVQAVLYGRIIHRGDQLTLSLELLDAVTENVIWSGKYDRKQADVVSLQSEIARDVSNKLKTKLSGADVAKVEKGYTANPEAYRLYLQGRFYWNKRTEADLKKSIEYFDQAIALDPAYALAHAGLADAWQVLPSYTSDPSPEEAYPKARVAAFKALAIDPDMAEPHAALGVILHEFEWKHSQAEKEFQRAIELNPNYASGRQWYGEYLRNMGRIDESLVQLLAAQELEPLSLIMNVQVAITYFAAGRNDEAIAQYHKTLEIDPNFSIALRGLATVYAAKGMFDEAIAYERKIALANGDPPDKVEKLMAALTEAYRKGGARGYWQQYLDLRQESQGKLVRLTLSMFTAQFTAQLYTSLGNKDEALALLEEVFEKDRYNKGLIRLKGNPVWEPLRAEPRFKELLRKVGLPE